MDLPDLARVYSFFGQGSQKYIKQEVMPLSIRWFLTSFCKLLALKAKKKER